MTPETPVNGSARWYAVQSKQRQEQRAEGDLLAWGVEAFLPRLWRRRASSRNGAGLHGSQPLFPGYLFARFDAERMLHKIRYTRGVVRVLGTEQGPTPLDDAIIALIRSRVGPDGGVQLSFEPGENLRITNGPLRDFIGVFSATVTPADRIRVLLTAVNGRFNVVVDADILERMTAPGAANTTGRPPGLGG